MDEHFITHFLSQQTWEVRDYENCGVDLPHAATVNNLFEVRIFVYQLPRFFNLRLPSIYSMGHQKSPGNIMLLTKTLEFFMHGSCFMWLAILKVDWVYTGPGGGTEHLIL